MEQKKRLTATKKAIEIFRSEHPSFTDEYLSLTVKRVYPGVYSAENDLVVGLEVLKEIYRRQDELTPESFEAVLREMVDGRQLVRYSEEAIKWSQTWNKVQSLLDQIYKDAQEKTVYLSQYPLYNEEIVREYFESECKRREKTLAQEFFYLLNNIAMREAGEMSGFYLPFHCYAEPNGDVVFTKNSRGKSDYDENGNPLVSEKEVEARKNKSTSQTNSGCLGMLMLLISQCIFVFLVCFVFSSCGTKQTQQQCPYPEDTFVIHGSVLKNVDSMEYYNAQAAHGDARAQYIMAASYYCTAEVQPLPVGIARVRTRAEADSLLDAAAAQGYKPAINTRECFRECRGEE